MNFFKITLLIFSTFIFTSCSQKSNISINEQMQSFYLDKDIKIYDVPKSVNSPVSFNIGLGGYIGNHVGIHVGKGITPQVENTDALNLQKALNKYKVSLKQLIIDEFSKTMRADTFYKNKFVPFGANHKIQLSLRIYDLDNSLISSSGTMSVSMDLKIIDKNKNTIFVTSKKGSSKIESILEMYKDKTLFLKALNEAIIDTSKKLISDMKKN